MNFKNIRDGIVEMLNAQPHRSFKAKELARLFKIAPKDYVPFRSFLRELTQEGVINKIKSNRYRGIKPKTELEGKFCMAFLLSSIILTGRAGKAEFTDAFVQSPESQAMQLRVETQYDPDIAAMGHDKILSRIEVVTKSGQVLKKFSDDRYRGGPNNPLSDAEVEQKFMDCVAGILSDERARQVLDLIWSLENVDRAASLLDCINS